MAFDEARQSLETPGLGGVSIAEEALNRAPLPFCQLSSARTLAEMRPWIPAGRASDIGVLGLESSLPRAGEPVYGEPEL